MAKNSVDTSVIISPGVEGVMFKVQLPGDKHIWITLDRENGERAATAIMAAMPAKRASR
jgi:hypothetical protein